MSDVTLYYFPGSFYSLKALLALNEKQATFKERLVNIHGGDQYAEWFLLINKYGEVPVLQIGNQYTSGSEEIIDLIDKTFPQGPRLVLDPNTPLGRELAEFRQYMQDIRIDCITFGVLANRQFCAGELMLPKFMTKKFNKETIVNNFTNLAKLYAERQKTCPPDLREAFQIKHDKVSARCAMIQDARAVGEILDSLEPVLDRIEARIIKSKQGADDGKESWLFGTEVTAADLIVVNFMYRLQAVGLGPRYFSDTIRPTVNDFYNRMMARPTVKKTFAVVSKMIHMELKNMMKGYVQPVMKLGLMAGILAVAYFGYRKFKG